MFQSRPANDRKAADEVEQGSEDLAGGNEDPNMVGHMRGGGGGPERWMAYQNTYWTGERPEGSGAFAHDSMDVRR